VSETGQPPDAPRHPPVHPHAHEDATIYVPANFPKWLVELVDQEVRLKGTSRSAVLREIVAHALDPQARKGGANYGYYLRARDVEKARALMASLSLFVLTLGGWTLGLLAAGSTL
jgi:hypothetical protein